ncbi:MAG: hydroxyisourate hydrolase [Rhodospirillales bacterium]|jgi:5-hydroxyisourate hydrolase|nr:hydroxyisourate hydrolase [Rhodospirillales bacterium]MBT4041774.1 hydroxyisourate hydrolase [Rhodospirillales bacterium]MBT4628496.1 hydroxyisourate hydrolase [Rhodospirillales bacterium]MBT5351753.1 hydroxyisourate hydrolase [Rhodospirillales bacterium]MBT5521544.1 hydroxyisourate hydrolase [Rhodospirillales bacterium]
MAGYLTTHVLDTSTGTPGHGMRIELFRLNGEDRTKLADVVTNDDGRCDEPILGGDDFAPGTYELLFHAGDYLDTTGADLPAPKFLDQIPIRFGISDVAAHYHVPLLISPYSYSTYRGS